MDEDQDLEKQTNKDRPTGAANNSAVWFNIGANGLRIKGLSVVHGPGRTLKNGSSQLVMYKVLTCTYLSI